MMIGFLAFFIGGLVIVFAPSMYRLAMGSSLTELEPAAREFLVLHLRVWPAALFIFGGMFVYTLFLSRRIAGPIYRVNSVLRQMIEGEYPEKVSLRYGDYFSETAELLERLSRKAAGEQGKKEHRENESRGPAAK
jgi:signal transduction histidine kinase